MRFKNVFTIVCLLAGSFTSSFACSCLATPTVLDEFDRSEDVFIAEIIKIKPLEGEATGDGGIWSKKDDVDGALARVEKTFKGALNPGDEIFLEQGGGANCIWTYRKEQVGIKVLIYNSPHNGKRYVSECGRSNTLRFVADDLRYLENIDEMRGRTRIAGTYKFGYFGGVPTGHTVENKKIRIVGQKQTFLVKTNKDGVYETYDLPPGKYYIVPEAPQGWKLSRYALERALDTNPPTMAFYEYLESREKWPNRIPIILERGKHVSLDLQYEIDNSISGQVLGPNGRPIKGICVTAVQAEKTEYKYGNSGCTDAKGRFVLSEFYNKEYVLVINGDGEVSGDEPVSTLFFPGVSERSAAKVIKVDQGIKLVLPPFRVSQLVETVNLTGTLYYSDGSLVTTHQKVQFISDVQDKTKKSDPYDYTDDLGRFEMKILKGQKGKIRAEMIMGVRQRAGCPSVLNGVVENKEYGGIFTVATEWQLVDAERSLHDLELKFAFPECKVL